MKVKICGITNIEDAIKAYELGADAVGFIFYNKSKRFIDFGDAESVISSLPTSIKKAGVFVNEDYNTINNIADNIGLDIIQLHGDELPSTASNIERTVWKAFRVGNDFNFDSIDSYKNCSIMLDTFTADEYGGSGKTFNWEIIPKKIRSNIILAGGISIDNIEAVYSSIKPSWIDVSSSLETYPGKKDKMKMEDFFKRLNTIRK